MIIYKRTNRVNGKVYIGKTKNAETIRWMQHVYYAKHGATTHLSNAINLYGGKVFDGKILYHAKTEYELKRMETFFIILHQSHNPSIGYNMTLGGDKEDYPSEAMKLVISKKIGLGVRKARARTWLRICYSCFKPFDSMANGNKEGIFCSRRCLSRMTIQRGKYKHTVWNKGIPASIEQKQKQSMKMKGRLSPKKGKHYRKQLV